MSADRGTGKLTEWIDGEPFQGIPSPENTGRLTCWVDAQPFQYMFPNSASSFFLVMGF